MSNSRLLILPWLHVRGQRIGFQIISRIGQCCNKQRKEFGLGLDIQFAVYALAVHLHGIRRNPKFLGSGEISIHMQRALLIRNPQVIQQHRHLFTTLEHQHHSFNFNQLADRLHQQTLADLHRQDG